MRRYTFRGFKYDEGSPMARLSELEDKIEDGELVEVVRCKDCSHWREDKQRCIGGVGGFMVGVEFCSSGNRRRSHDEKTHKFSYPEESEAEG